MDRQTGAGDEDLVLCQFPAIEMHGWLILISGENNRGPFPARRDVQNTRQTFDAALHPQSVEVNARRLGTVFATAGDDPLYPRASHVRIECIGVGKCHDLAVRHIKPPVLLFKPRRIGSAACLPGHSARLRSPILCHTESRMGDGYVTLSCLIGDRGRGNEKGPLPLLVSAIFQQVCLALTRPLVMVVTVGLASAERCRRDVCWNLFGAVSGWMRILDQAARSIGLSASFWVSVSHPSTLRMVI